MIQLAFDPALDPFHAAFRVIRATTFVRPATIEIPRLKLLDLYLAEPERCLEIRLSGEIKAAARRAAACQPPTYGLRPGAVALFNRMRAMQDAAIQTLVGQGLLDADAFGKNRAIRTDLELDDDLRGRIDAANSVQFQLMKFLYVDLEQIVFNGPNGLKDRTGLGDYQHDLV
jgi:hypothetical protein